MGLINYLL